MYNSDTELMFPLRVVQQLRNQRGESWAQLTDKVSAPLSSTAEQAAFTLMMVRLGGCQGCSVDSFRGMRGCTACARQTIKRFRGSDAELIAQYELSYKDIEQYLVQE